MKVGIVVTTPTGIQKFIDSKSIKTFAPFPEHCEIQTQDGKVVRTSNNYARKRIGLPSLQTLMNSETLGEP